MRKDRAVLELSPATREHLLALPESFVNWKGIAFAVAVDVGCRLLQGNGDGACDEKVRRLIRNATPDSPAVTALLERLPRGRRPWSNRIVAEAVAWYFQIGGVEKLRLVIAHC